MERRIPARQDHQFQSLRPPITYQPEEHNITNPSDKWKMVVAVWRQPDLAVTTPPCGIPWLCSSPENADALIILKQAEDAVNGLTDWKYIKKTLMVDMELAQMTTMAKGAPIT